MVSKFYLMQNDCESPFVYQTYNKITDKTKEKHSLPMLTMYKYDILIEMYFNYRELIELKTQRL